MAHTREGAVQIPSFPLVQLSKFQPQWMIWLCLGRFTQSGAPCEPFSAREKRKAPSGLKLPKVLVLYTYFVCSCSPLVAFLYVFCIQALISLGAFLINFECLTPKERGEKKKKRQVVLCLFQHYQKLGISVACP